MASRNYQSQRWNKTLARTYFLCFDSPLKQTRIGPDCPWVEGCSWGRRGWPRRPWRVRGRVWWRSGGRYQLNPRYRKAILRSFAHHSVFWCNLLYFREEQLIKHMEINLIFSLCWKPKKMESGALFFQIVLPLPPGIIDGPSGYSLFWVRQIVAYKWMTLRFYCYWYLCHEKKLGVL